MTPRMTTFVTLFLIALGTTVPADEPLDVDNEPVTARTTHVIQPPPELRAWTPAANQFQLYVNFDGASGDTLPHIDILNDRASWPFLMEKLGDTVYLFITPPGYQLKARSKLDSLDAEFPVVVWAGTERAVYWFSYDSGQVTLDTLQPAPFITTVEVRPLPDNVLTLQLVGKNKHAKTIRNILSAVGDRATIVRLPEGYYQNVWYRVLESVVQRYETNETQVGTLVALQCVDGAREAVAQILKDYGEAYATHQ